MKTKQDAIREAYGELWEELKSKINKSNGFTDIENVNFKTIRERNFQINHTVGICRPASLIGIEKNNGWIRIESEADLPKEDIECWFKEKDEIILGLYNSKQHRFDNPIKRLLYANPEYVTHYQPINKPLPPIY